MLCATAAACGNVERILFGLLCSTSLFISSPEPKAQESFSYKNLSFVRRRCLCSSLCRKIFTFSSFLQNHLANISQTGTKPPWVKGNQVCSNEGHRQFLPNSENTPTNFKNLLLQNHWAYFNQTRHKSYLDERDSILFKMKGSALFQGEIIAKLH